MKLRAQGLGVSNRKYDSFGVRRDFYETAGLGLPSPKTLKPIWFHPDPHSTVVVTGLLDYRLVP